MTSSVSKRGARAWAAAFTCCAFDPQSQTCLVAGTDGRVRVREKLAMQRRSDAGFCGVHRRRARAAEVLSVSPSRRAATGASVGGPASNCRARGAAGC